MNTSKEYIDYVKNTLSSIRISVKASYDTGFGLVLTSEQLGDTPDTIYVIQHKVSKINAPPSELDSDAWDTAWQECKQLVREYIVNTHCTCSGECCTKLPYKVE